MGSVGAARALPGSPPLPRWSVINRRHSLVSPASTSRRQDHLRHRRDARHGSRRQRATRIAAIPVGLFSDRAAQSRRRGHVGYRGHRLQRRIVRGVALPISDSSRRDDKRRLAASVPSSDGVDFVPALSGLGTPQWDFGARGGFFGITRGSSRPTWFAPYSRASPSAAPTSSTRPKRESGHDSTRFASTAG